MTQHSTKLANRLLREHFDRRQEGPIVRYHPKTPEAHHPSIRVHTGVCPECLTRSITVGRCIQCGWEGEDHG